MSESPSDWEYNPNLLDIEMNHTTPFAGEYKKNKFNAFSGKYIVIYFYPKDNTPGCTNESMGFRDQTPLFNEHNAVIFGVSRDTLKSHDHFKQKLELPFELISDTEETLCLAFDTIKQKKMYGKNVRGIERSTFLISPDGKLIKSWRKVRVANHVNEVLEHLIKDQAS